MSSPSSSLPRDMAAVFSPHRRPSWRGYLALMAVWSAVFAVACAIYVPLAWLALVALALAVTVAGCVAVIRFARG